jgi:hypothetical protein
MTVTKQWTFPRRFSKTHCMKKTCKQMGFTEKASCRPYKNCYNGGTRSGPSKRSTRRRGRSTTRRSGIPRSALHPAIQYKSQHLTFTSHPAKGEPHGLMTVVALKNGRGTKAIRQLNRKGKTLKSNTKPLKKHEMDQILKGNYVPGLWGV